ncbi:TlpA family protein disulfide reductase [Sphingomonas sp. Leaf343]|uniref:TlpA family protein disulfide reductase n=1 Tax=Sphingomonas sp. Leaf343 TaxID=1736345 RepID=UPI000ADB8293|nr:TlpA disulfide reductase family protein [Sphingomonas sp. Leaf343]
MAEDLSTAATPNYARTWKLWKRLWIGFAVLLLAACAMLFVAARRFDSEPLPPGLASSGTLPVTMPDGRRAQLRDIVRSGRPTVINLWASWCGPCRQEAPDLKRLRQAVGPAAINFVALNVRDDRAIPEDRADFLQAAGLSPADYSVMAEALVGKLTGRSDNLIPRTLVYDRAGQPLATITGYKPLALARVAALIQE